MAQKYRESFGTFNNLLYLCNRQSKMTMKESKPYLILDGVLQVTPDIEEEIAEVERGEVVSMSEFKTMFAKWL